MPRDSNGNYTLPAGNPVVTATIIQSSWANNTLSDVATALTNSLDRNGDGGMLAALELFAGTVGTPGLSWTLESTSGLYRNAAGDFRYSISGADALQITANGIRVVDGSITAPSQSFISDTDLGWFRIGANVIGLAPAATVAMVLGHSARLFTRAIEVDSSGASAGESLARFSADASGPVYESYKSRNATVGSHTIVQSGDELGRFDFYGSDGTNFDLAAQIFIEVDGTPGSGTDMPGRIRFLTSPDGSATPAERLRISQNDKVRVGNNFTEALDSTGAKFEIVVDGTANMGIRDATNNIEIYIGAGSTSGFLGTPTNHDFGFYTNNTLRFTIEADGSWGINGSNGSSGDVLTSAGSGSTPTWSAPAGFAPVSKFKSAQTDRTSDTTLSDDPHLAGWSLQPSATYHITGGLFHKGNGVTNNGFKFAFDFNGAIADIEDFRGSLLGSNLQAVTNFRNESASGGNWPAYSAGVLIQTQVDVFVNTKSSLTPGTLMDFQWAQQTSQGTATSLEKGSYLVVQRLT